jgi:ribosomal protein S12 methylthiotransferase accessory factor
MKPIYYRGQPLSAKKTYFDGMHRTASPEETWEKIKPLAPKIGVTRVANITGLDRIGVPVTVALRPASLTIATSTGKGLTLPIALVSGLMESIELHCAEEAQLPFITSSYNQLIERMPAVALHQLKLKENSLFHPDWPERWTVGFDLCSQQEIAAPLMNVLMYNHDAAATDIKSFATSSNGIASGNQLIEAIAGAIYELIERDGIACHKFATQNSSYRMPRVRLKTIPFSAVRQLIDQLDQAGIQLFLFDCTVDTAVPVFMAIIYDKLMLHVGSYAGYGAHLDPQVAMIRAITEAIQGRTVIIAGSRDDFFSSHFAYMRKYDSLEYRNYLDSIPETVDAALYRSEAKPSLEEDVDLLLTKLLKAGLDQVIVFDLTDPTLNIPVVRVLIPGLECYHGASACATGRARAFLRSQVAAPTSINNSIALMTHMPAGARE